ncbi:hypothetical protein BGX38DRAFT_1175396, partial [Terfezia claveryi]
VVIAYSSTRKFARLGNDFPQSTHEIDLSDKTSAQLHLLSGIRLIVIGWCSKPMYILYMHLLSDLLGTQDACGALKPQYIDPAYRVKWTDSWASRAVAGHDLLAVYSSVLFLCFDNWAVHAGAAAAAVLGILTSVQCGIDDSMQVD